MSDRPSGMMSAYAAVISDIAICSLFISSVLLMSGHNEYPGLFHWAAACGIQLIISEILISMEVPLNLYIAASGFFVCAAGAMMAFFWSGDLSDMYAVGFYTAAAAGTSLHMAVAAYTRHKPDMLQRYADILAVSAAFYIYVLYYSAQSISSGLALLSAAAAAADLMTASAIRVCGECRSTISGKRPLVLPIIAATIFLCAICSVIVPAYGTGQVQSAVDVLLKVLYVIWRIIDTVMTGFAMALGYILYFFIRILPEGGIMTDSTTLIPENEAWGENAETYESPSQYVYIIAAVLAAACIMLALYSIRKLRIKRMKRRSVRMRAVRKSHALSALISLFGAIRGRLAFEICYLAHRKTPEGLYILAKRRGVLSGLKKNTSESPGAYIRRLAAVSARDAASADKSGSSVPADGSRGGADLKELAGILDRIYYNGEKSMRLGRDEYRAYAAVITRITKPVLPGRRH